MVAEFIRRVYEDGKITIPKDIRDLNGINAGDYVRVEVEVVKKVAESITGVKEK